MSTEARRPAPGLPPASGAAGAARSPVRRVGAGLLAGVLPAVVALWVASTTFPGGTLVPWHPVMVDLEVYRQAGAAALRGVDFYALPGLPFLYPPFAALLATVLSVLPSTVVQVGWVLANVAALLAVLSRFGLRTWALSLVATASIYFVEPVQQTLAFGQVGIVLVALVVVDLVPGAGEPADLVESRRRGVLTGIAAAVKLTPGLFAVYLFLAGRRRAAFVTIGSFVAAGLVAAIFLPGPSLAYWNRLAHGDTGLGHSVIYFTNQSVMGSWLRIFGLGSASTLGALTVSALVAVLGVAAAVRWHRRGDVRIAVCLGGVASLLASPVSWSHHFVWVVPLAVCLWSTPGLSAVLRCVGFVFVGWVVAAPYKRLPNGADVELTYTWGQNLLDSVTLLLGLTLLLVGLAVAVRRQSPTSDADGLQTERPR
ncbi:MAG: glycosyltransferase 87 family protein [Propionibacteriaceae bacterium]